MRLARDDVRPCDYDHRSCISIGLLRKRARADFSFGVVTHAAKEC
jgi:hypothetical protein